MDNNEFLLKIKTDYNKDKLSKIAKNQFFLHEVALVLSMPKGIEYYNHIITNVDIDRTNPKNSFIMWLYNKVDTIDLKRNIEYKRGRVELPDIDLDVPKAAREPIIAYLKQKYGADKVAQIITFQSMKARAALKNVLRAREEVSAEEAELITKGIPPEGQISDELQEMEDETGQSSIILWALENRADKFKDWCYIDKEGQLQGSLADSFKQAIRLEGTKSASSKHPAGVVISAIPLKDICPMVRAKDSNQIAGFEMKDLESVGMIKYDILGIGALDKIQGVINLLKTGAVK